MQEKLLAKPPSIVKKTQDGFLLVEGVRQRKKLTLWSFIYYSLLTLIIGFIGFFMLAIIISAWLGALLSVAIAACIPGIRRKVLARLRRFYLAPGELVLSNHPLHLGEECTINFQRQLRMRQKAQQKGSMCLKIACVEQATYSYEVDGHDGKETKAEYRSHIVWESQPKYFPIASKSDTLNLTTSFTVFDHLPPSFEGKCDQIRWFIHVQQTIPGIVEEICSEFTFVVAPERYQHD